MSIMGIGTSMLGYANNKIDNEVKVSSYPSSARTIYLDLDKFITLGTAS